MNTLSGFKSGFLPYICFDIEKAKADQAAIDAEIALYKPKGNWKPETVEKNRLAHEVKAIEKSALMESAPVASIAICDINGNSIAFHWLLVQSGLCEDIYTSHQSADEKEMLLALRDWTDLFVDDNTSLVGFNIDFDMSHLRMAYVRHGLKLPAWLVPWARNAIHDLMKIYTRYFTSKATIFIGLGEVVQRLGIAPEGKQMSGSDVPIYIDKGFTENDPAPHLEVLSYNVVDSLLTMRGFMICVGIKGD